jgi:hypothetical protein
VAELSLYNVLGQRVPQPLWTLGAGRTNLAEVTTQNLAPRYTCARPAQPEHCRSLSNEYWSCPDEQAAVRAWCRETFRLWNCGPSNLD